MLASAAGFDPLAGSAPVETAVAADATSAHVAQATPAKSANPNAGIEAKVRAYWSDAPIMAKVAYCESEFRQFDGKTGKVMRGWANPADVGVMQINETAHAAAAKKLGFDIYSLDGNLAYARYLYEHQGLDPWVYSKPCWSGQLAVNAK